MSYLRLIAFASNWHSFACLPASALSVPLPTPGFGNTSLNFLIIPSIDPVSTPLNPKVPDTSFAIPRIRSSLAFENTELP